MVDAASPESLPYAFISPFRRLPLYLKKMMEPMPASKIRDASIITTMAHTGSDLETGLGGLGETMGTKVAWERSKDR